MESGKSGFFLNYLNHPITQSTLLTQHQFLGCFNAENREKSKKLFFFFVWCIIKVSTFAVQKFY